MPLHLLIAELGPKGRGLSRASAARREAAAGPGQGPSRRPPRARCAPVLGRQGTGSASLALRASWTASGPERDVPDIAEPLRSPRRRCRRGPRRRRRSASCFLLLAAALVGLLVLLVVVAVVVFVDVRPGGRLRARRCPSAGLRPAREDRSAAERPHCQGIERRAGRRRL